MLYSGLCSISFRNLSCEEIVEICKKASIQSIEWGSDVHLPIGDFVRAKQVKKLCDENHILTRSYGTYFECENSTIFEEYCKIAAILDAKVLRIWAGNKNKEDYSLEEENALIKVIQECADIAKKYNQNIGFEFHHTTYCNSTENAIKLIKLVNRDNVFSYYQPRYWNKEPLEYLRVQDNLRDIQEIKNYVINIHCYQWDKDINRLPLSEGFYQWNLYLDSFDDCCVYLEFIEDDSVDNFFRDAKTLNEIIKRQNEKPSKDINEFTEEEVYGLLDEKELNKPIFPSKEELLKDNLKFLRFDLLKKTCDSFIDEPIPAYSFEDYENFFKTGIRSECESRFFLRRKRIGQLALLAYVSDEEKYLNRLIDYLMCAANEYSWVIPGNFETVHGKISDNDDDRHRLEISSGLSVGGFAEVIALLKDKLPNDVYKLVYDNIVKRGFDALKHQAVWKDEYPVDNWAVVTGGGVIIAALMLLKDKKELAHVLTPCINACIHYYWSFAEDGMIKEGAAGYWNFGIGMFVIVAELLKEKTGGKIDFFKLEKFKNVVMCLSKVTFNNNLAVSFADSQLTYEYLYGVMAKLKDIYPELKVYDSEKNRNAYVPLLTKNPHIPFLFAEIMWAKEIKFDQVQANTYFLKDAEWLISTSDNNVLFACKGGCTYEPHCHLDIGNFILFKGNDIVIPDLGAGEYDRAYWDEATRYDDVFVVTSKSHCVPIINGHYQLAGHEMRSENTSYENGIFTTNITKAYGKLTELKSLIRSFDFNLKNGSLVVKDLFELNVKEIEIKERIISLTKPIVKDGIINIKSEKESLFVSCNKSKVVEINSVEYKDRTGTLCTCYTCDFIIKTTSLCEVVSLELKFN